MPKKKSMKGQYSNLPLLAVGFIVILIITAFAAQILEGINDTANQQNSNSTLWNITNTGSNSLQSYSDFFSSLGLLIMLVIIIGVIAALIKHF